MADPAFRGFVESTLDALLVFEGCKRGYLPKISRRLQDYEKKALVVSGAIFVFDEEETGIKRWTDGLSWSPSRTLGNFLIYRELDKKAPSGSNKEEEEEAPTEKTSTGTHNASRLMGGLTSKSDPLDDANDLAPVPSTSSNRPSNVAPRQRSLSEVAGVLTLDRARERALVGSLTSSYRFRSDGLVKKTISLSGLHLVAYYRLEDVTSGRLRTPSSHAELMSLEVSPGFLTPSLFRMPPVVEVGLDGQIRYKGESDTPISPLTRSGSSQGFPTPNLNQSRPATSDPYTSSAPSHLTPNLGARPPSRDYPAAPGSPRRGATATVRSANRFDPYSVGARYSPNATAYSSTSSYPFTPSQPSPNRATFSTIDETTVDFHRRDSSNEGRLVGSMGENLGSSTMYPQQQGGWYGQSQNQMRQSLPNEATGSGGGGGGGGRASFAIDNSNNFYRPEPSTSYGPPNSAGGASTSSNTVFNFNPPPPPPRRASDFAQRPPQSALPARPVSQQHRPSSVQHTNSFTQYDSSGYLESSFNNSTRDDYPQHLPQSSSSRGSSVPASALSAWNFPNSAPAPPPETTYAYDQPNGLVAAFQEKQPPVADALGLYQTESLYDQSHAPSRPLAYRQASETQFVGQSSLSPHNGYPPTSSSTSSSVPAGSNHQQQQHYGLAEYSSERLPVGWQQKSQGNASFGPSQVQANAGWWNAAAQDCAEPFWQGQGVMKKEYSQG